MISIIVPVYKVEKYLPECIESVLAQTYIDWEMLLIDDGSPDSCPAICDEFAQRDSRIRAIHKENGGVGSARNRGLDEAKGEFIMFLDGDDCLSNSILQVCIDKIINSPYGIVAVECETINEDSSLYHTQRPSFDEYELDSESYIKRIALCKLQTAIWGKLFRRALIGSHRFIDELKVGEDLLFLELLLVLNDTKVLITSDRLYRYRIIDSSVTRSCDSIKFTNNELLVKYTIQIYNELTPAQQSKFGKYFSFGIISTLLLNIHLIGYIKYVPKAYFPILNEYCEALSELEPTYYIHVKKLLNLKGVRLFIYVNKHYIPYTVKRKSIECLRKIYSVFKKKFNQINRSLT